MKQLTTNRPCKVMTAFAVLLLGILLFTAAPDTACAEDGDTAITEWQELQNRIDSVQGTGTITLQKDYKAVAADSALTIPKGSKVTLDLNGHTLDRGQPRDADGTEIFGGEVISVIGTLTLNDSDGDGRITGGLDLEAAAIYVYGGTLIMNGGTLTGNGSSRQALGTISVVDGKFTMNGGTITGNNTCGAGGVYVLNAEFQMNGGRIINNNAEYGGGVAVDSSGTFKMRAGEISGNHGSSALGVLSWGWDEEQDTIFDLSGGSIKGDSDDVPVISVEENGTFNISGDPTIDNKNGAEVYLSSGKRINVTGPLDKALSLSVLTKETPAEGTPVTITSGLQNRGDIFNFYSYEDYGVGADSAGEAVLGTPALDIIYKAGRGSGSDIKKKGIQDYRYTLEDCTFEPPAGMKFKGWIFWSNPTVYPAGHTYKLNSSKRLTAQYDCIAHDWSEPNYEWTEDHGFVTATRTCGVGGETETETAAAAGTITEPTCTEMGLKTYTSETFANSAFSVQTETGPIEAIGHTWGAWKVTKKPTALNTGTKQRVCENDPSHVQKQTIPATGVSGTLLAKMTPSGSKSLKVTWTKIKGAEGYDIFFARCNADGKEIVCKKVKTVKGNKTFKLSRSGLKKQTAYKVYVKAFAAKNGKKTYIRTSPVMHAFTGGYDKKYTNAKAVTLKKTTVTLKKGKTYQIKAGVTKLKAKKTLMGKGHAAKLRYLSSNKKIAVVSKAGKITAKAKGTCTVYVYAHNGVSKTIKVTVR